MTISDGSAASVLARPHLLPRAALVETMKIIKNATWLVMVLFAAGITQDIPLEDLCTVKNSESRGKCVIIQSCPQAIILLKLNDYKSLKSMSCGFHGLDVKVCCPNENATDGAHSIIVFHKENNSTVANNTGPPKATPIKEIHVYSDVTTTTHTPVHLPLTTPYTPKTTSPSEGAIDDKSSDDNQNTPYSTYQHPENSAATLDEDVNLSPLSVNKKYASKYSSLPDRNTCGLFTVSDRIFGGDITAIDEFPWLVRIRYRLNRKIDYACAGSLINDLYVVTAAHCVLNQNIIDVRLGEWDEDKESECYGEICNDPPVDLKVAQTIIHPEFSRRSFTRGDIALLRLERSVNFTDFIRPVCLPTTEFTVRQDYTPESTYLTAGWGKTELESKSPIKRKVQLNAVSMTVCRVAHQTVISEEMVPVTICAGGRRGQDSCQGDSGSSLVKQITEDDITSWFLYGVTSLGPRNCGTEGKPGLYTRVAKYMDWILDNIQS